MRRCTKKAHYHATRIIQIILLLIFPLRNCSVNGQISHHTDYDIAAGRRSGGSASAVNGGANSDSNEDESISSQPNGMHTNGEILGPKSFPLSAQEPSCEELRAMWIFSKRQSRAAEMSNEIPTYRDPFAYNVWEPMYPAGRGVGSRTISHYREPTRPVFGRVISREPVVLQRLPVRTRIFDDVPSRLYGSETRSAMPSIGNGVGPRKYMQYRFSGTQPYGNAQANGNNPNLVHQGSFQKLKELIWTERAKELTQQRKAEELAARAAVLKELSAGQLINRHPEQNDEPMPNEQNLSPDQQDHHLYHQSTDGRISIGNGKQPGVIKSIFSGNPSNPNSARSGRLLLPSMIGGDARERGNLQRNFPMRPSHFRERNRVLFRQSTPSDFYQRESRSESLKSLPYEHQIDRSSRPYSSTNDPDRTEYNNNNKNQYQYQTSILNSNNDLQQSSEMQQQQQLNDMIQKLYQIDQLSFLAGYPSSLNSKTKFNYDDNISIGSDSDSNSRKRRHVLSNINFVKHSLSNDSY